MYKKFLLFLLLILLAVPVTNTNAQTIKIFVTNDVHGYIEHSPPDDIANSPGKIGYAHLKGYINESPAQVKFLMDAGDAFSGSVYARMDYGQTIAKIMGQMDYNYITPGNHAFDFNALKGSTDYYSSLIDVLRLNQRLYTNREKNDLCNVLAQNIHYENGQPLRNVTDKPVIIYDETKTDKNGLRIIVTGIITPGTPGATDRPNTKGLVFGDKESILKNLEKSLKKYNRKKDIVLMLAHLGDKTNKSGLKGPDLAAVKNIDIIVDAHSHNLHLPEYIDGSLYMIAGQYLENFVEITIDSDAKVSAQIVGYNQVVQVKPDPKIVDLITQLTQDSVITSPVGALPADISLAWHNNDTRFRTTDLGRFICAAIQQTTQADLTVLNGGSMRAPLNGGTIRRLDLLNTLPLISNIVTIKMTAAEIKTMFNQRFSRPDIFLKPDGGFPQFYGMQVDIITTQNSYIVADIKKDGLSILKQPEKTYIVAINSFMLNGGNRYNFKQNNILRSDFGDAVDVLTDVFKSGYPLKMDYGKIKQENLRIIENYVANTAS